MKNTEQFGVGYMYREMQRVAVAKLKMRATELTKY
jgi:hypothetical protein